MATLNELYGMETDELRNQIVAACWNVAKGILTNAGATQKEIEYARDNLLTKLPAEKIVLATIVLIQNEESKTDETIQGAVDSVVEKLIIVEA